MPSIRAWNALFPQPSNNNWQRVPVNKVAPIPLDFLLFDADGKPMDGVGVTPMDLRRFPRYTLGLLVKDNNVVGGISGAAPPGATGQVALSPIDAAVDPFSQASSRCRTATRRAESCAYCLSPGTGRAITHPGLSCWVPGPFR